MSKREIDISWPVIAGLGGVVLVVFLVIGLFGRQSSSASPEAKEVLEAVTNNNVMKENKEVKEEVLVVRNTNVPVAVFTADKNELKKQLQKQLAKEQSKNVN